MDQGLRKSIQPAVSRKVIEEKTLKSMRNRFQKGSLRRMPRKSGADVWEYQPFAAELSVAFAGFATHKEKFWV